MPIYVLDDFSHIDESLGLAVRGLRVPGLEARQRRASLKPRAYRAELGVDLDMTVYAFKAEHDRYQVI